MVCCQKKVCRKAGGQKNNRLQLPGGHSNNSSPAASLERSKLEF